MYERYATRDEAKASIVEAIEAGGNAVAADYDIDAILGATYSLDVVTDEDGNERVDQTAWICVASVEEFWASVAAADKASV